VEMAYLGFRIRRHSGCSLAWICGLGGGQIMFFQKLLGKFLDLQCIISS
jgi:hypothetical protein